MKRFLRNSFVLVLALAMPALGMAGTRDPGVNNRQVRQSDRIEQGVTSGELNRREARRLHRKERVIREKEDLYKADGNLSRAERRDLHRDLNALSRDIKHEKHDIQQR